jgi:hypothetical protein
VLVSAPTSSGKTVVAEYAIFRALRAGSGIYTTPLKRSATRNSTTSCALRRRTVGLVTGEELDQPRRAGGRDDDRDLRNLIYEDLKAALVSYVVLDEVITSTTFARLSLGRRSSSRRQLDQARRSLRHDRQLS